MIEDMPVRDWRRAQTAQEKPELQNDIDEGHRRKRRLIEIGGVGKKTIQELLNRSTGFK